MTDQTNDSSSLAATRITLPTDLRMLAAGQMRRTRLPLPDILRLALMQLEERFPSGGGSATSGPTFDLAELRDAYAMLEQSRAAREFVIRLAARQRTLAHPEAIMQATAEALGRKLGVCRCGFYRTRGPGLDYGACWTDGTVSPLAGHLPIERLGSGLVEPARTGRTIVAENSRTDPIVASPHFPDVRAIALIGVPLIRDREWVAGLYAHHPEPRHWHAEEIALVEEVANLAWDAVERATALLALRDQVGHQSRSLDRAAGDLRSEQARSAAAEGQVRQLQKMEAVSQLTGGIAHDFNNMLAVIVSGLNLMQRRLARGDTDVGRYMDAVMDGTSRAAALTQRLLAFSRQQPLNPQPLDPNRLIAGMTELLTRTLGETVRVETVLAAGLWAAKADPSQLENTVLNLAVNARDAMPQGGRLTIESANAHVDADYAARHDMPEGQYVQLAVSDTGTGISPDVLERIFDPFFTTKEHGKGTGLGLSQVFGFVRQSGGAVRVYSELGHGTSVKIFLPRHYGDAKPIEQRLTHEPVRGGSPHEVILVVEDEDRVRNHNVEALREFGYTVRHASSGAEALAMIANGQAATLLFTDIVMPGMTGRELADRAGALLPGLKIVYTTGYTRNAVVHNGVLDPGTNFLPKPHSIDQLAAIVRRVLDS